MKNKKGEESQETLMNTIIVIALFILLLFSVTYLIKFLTGGN